MPCFCQNNLLPILLYPNIELPVKDSIRLKL